MARIAVLIGRVENQALTCLGVAEGNDIDKIVALRSKVIEAGGLHKIDKNEVRLTELRLLSNVQGGELKGAFRWPSTDAIKLQAQREKDRAAANAKAKTAAPAPAAPVAKSKK